MTEQEHQLIAADQEDIRLAFDEFMETFDEFKKTNDEKIDALQKRDDADVLIEEKIRRIEKSLQEQEDRMLRAQRVPIGNAESDEREAKAALDAYVRKGRTDGYTELQQKGMSVGSEADGGYLVPEATETEILQAMKSDSPIRSLASNITISTAVYKRPFALSGVGAGWVAETDPRPETTSSQLTELNYPTMELYACPAATKQLLDDSAVDIDNWLASEIYAAFAEQETRAFVTGDGTVSPKGFLAYPQQPASTASFGQIGYIATGIAGDFDPSEPADVLLDLVHTLGQKYRRNGTFLMNRTTLSRVRRLKTADGDYLWQPRLGETLETNLLGFPVAECDDMPDIAAGSASIAFGDFRRAYLIVDRQGVQILRDPYSSKPYVLFYATKRVGGGMSDFNALKLLKFGVS